MPCIDRWTICVAGLALGCVSKGPVDSVQATTSLPVKSAGESSGVECPRRQWASEAGPWRVVAFDRGDGTVWDLTSKAPGEPATVRQYFQYGLEPGQRTLAADWEFQAGELVVNAGGSGVLRGARLQGSFRGADKMTIGSVEMRDQVSSEKESTTYKRPIVVALDRGDSFWDILEWMHDCSVEASPKPISLRSDTSPWHFNAGSSNKPPSSVTNEQVNDDTSMPVTLGGLNGSWTGLSVDGDVLLTGTVDAGHMKLTVVERDGGVARAFLYQTAGLSVANGTIAIGGSASPLGLRCELVRDWGSGWGTCSLRLRRGEPSERTTDVFLFLLRDRSWLEHVFNMRRRWR